MRRKSDMWQDFANPASFLPGEGEQAASAAAADALERLSMVEEQLRSQFTSMAAYAQIAQQTVDNARAESRADLDREKATIISLVERVREELHGGVPMSPLVPVPAPIVEPVTDPEVMARLAALEDGFAQLNRHLAQALRSQEDLANSISIMFERQLHDSGWLASCSAASV